MKQLNNLHQEVLKLLTVENTSYAKPISSENIGKALNVTPSYIRSQLAELVRFQFIGVRRGNGGGYYIMGGVDK